MVDSATVVIQAVKFGYKRYGAKGAIAAAVAVGASYVVIQKVIPRYTDIDEERVDDVYERATKDDELGNILGEEFDKKFGEYLENGTDNE
jgi:hypothetical protein